MALPSNFLYTISARSQQIFDEAMKHGHVESRNIKALIFGAAGTGKSHTLALIMDEEPPKVRRSTPCATRPVRAVSRSRIERKGKMWVRVTPDDFSDTIADTATVFPSEIASTSETTRTATASSTPASAASPKVQAHPAETHSSSSSSEVSSAPILSVEEKLLQRIERSPYGHHAKKAFERDCISLIDTGGQPQFHEVLPAFMRGISASMFVIRLDESLGAHPLIEYYDDDGNRVGTPYYSPYTNQQVLMQCMRVIQSQASQSEDGQCANPIFVGTHRDLEHHCEETREEKNRKLREMLPPAVKAEAIYYGEDMRKLIFPVDAKNPGPEDKEVASELRNIVVKRSSVKPRKIPLRWHALELALQKLMLELGRGVLSKTECLAVARRFHFDHESFEEALQYLDKLSILFYYKEVLPDLIFCDSQVLLDKITELVEYNYHLRTDPNQSKAVSGKLLKFRDQGIITLDFLKQEGFARHYVPGLFTADELLKLFKKLLIVSQVTKEEYLMPCLLPVADQPSLLAPCSSIPSLLFYFPHSPLVGVFCALIAYLLSEARWELLYDPDSGSPSKVDRNTVHFRVPRDLPGKVILTDSFSFYFQVSIQLPQKDPYQLCSKVCPQIRETIRAGLRRASSTLNYNNSVPREAFFCEEHTDSTPHHASVVGSDCALMTCTVNPAQVYSNLSKLHLLWFGHQSATACGEYNDLCCVNISIAVHTQKHKLALSFPMYSVLASLIVSSYYLFWN